MIRFTFSQLNLDHVKKTIILISAFFVLSTAKAQSITLDSIPTRDSLIFYEKVFSIPEGMNKDAVFNSVVQWCASEFKNSNDVIKLSDRGNGEIVGNSSFKINIAGFASLDFKYNVRYMFRVDIRDKKYRIQVNNFTKTYFGIATWGKYRPAEIDYRHVLAKKGSNYKIELAFFNTMNKSTNDAITSLANFVNKSKSNNF